MGKRGGKRRGSGRKTREAKQNEKEMKDKQRHALVSMFGAQNWTQSLTVLARNLVLVLEAGIGSQFMGVLRSQ
jgi:mannitol-specific phosphotransferase system IIBC component